MRTQIFIGLALISAVSVSACGDGKSGWMGGKNKADSTAATCWEAGDVVACDLRGCPKECVLTIEKSGHRVDVIAECPKHDEYIELNPADVEGYDIVCQGEKKDDYEILSYADERVSDADVKAWNDYATDGATKPAGETTPATAPVPAAPVAVTGIEAMTGFWKATSFKVTDKSDGKTQDFMAYGTILMAVTPDAKALWDFSQLKLPEGLDGDQTSALFTVKILGGGSLKLLEARDEAFLAKTSGTQMTWSQMPFDGDGYADVTWERVGK